VCLLQWGQNLLNSKRPVVLRRFLVLVYRETPGERLSGLLRHSVHSRVMMIRAPLLLAIIFQKARRELTQITIFSHFAANYQLIAEL
jgi:hypothetical protein